MNVLSFAYVGHPVANLQRSRRFYEETLRLDTPRVIGGSLDSDEGMLEYDIGAHTIAITTYWTKAKAPEHPSSGLVLEVQDFKAAIAHLEHRQINFLLGPFEGSGCSIAVIADPDGNKIGIHQNNKATSRERNAVRHFEHVT